MKIAVRIGCSILEFWELTPYELFLKIEADRLEKEREWEDKIKIAWLNARMTIQFLGKKSQHPSLDKLLNKKPKAMTSEEMLREVKRLNAMFGGEIRYEKTPTERSEKLDGN